MQDILYLDRFDLAYEMNLKNAISILKDEELDILVQSDDINDVVNLYNCFRCLVLALSNSDIKGDTNDVKAGKGKIAIALNKYVKSLKSTNFITVYGLVKNIHKSSFWDFVNQYSIYKSMKPVIKDFLSTYPHALSFIVRYKDICKYFDNEIREYMLTDPRTSEIVIFKHKVKGYQETYLPESLTIEDVEYLFEKYIDGK